MDQPPQSQPPSIPDQTSLQPEGVSNRVKRWIYLGIMSVVSLIVIANLIGSQAGAPAAKPKATSQQQNATAADIRSTEEMLAQQQAALVSKTAGDVARLRRAQQQAGQAGVDPGANTNMDEQLARLAQLQDAQARAASAAPYGSYSPGGQPDNQKAQMHAEQIAQERKALFADNVVRQDAPPGAAAAAAMPGYPPSVYPAPAPESLTPRTGAPTVAAPKPGESQRKALDFDRNLKTYWLPEGTLLEAVLTNRLDGDGVGPVNGMTTTDAYLPGTRLLVIPQGSRVLGEASKVSATGQQRLAVAFHRIIVPGLHEYSIPLDGKPPALAQAGEVGLHDKVNSHYASIFGASLAIGAIGGLAQIGNGQSGFGYDPAVQFRAGVSSGMTQSSERVLDRFLNRLPTITIREGTRIRILLTDDLQLPAYERTNQ
jgi:type IV secretion system protein VirB10